MNFDPLQTSIVHEWAHGKPLIACCFDPQGRFIFSSSEDYTLQRWMWGSGEKLAWEAHESWVNALAVLPGGDVLLSAGCDDRLMFWPASDSAPKPLREVIAHKGWVRAVAVSADGALIATGGNDHLVKLWSPQGEPLGVFTGHDSHVYSLFFHPQGQYLLSGDLSGKVHQWELPSGKLVRTFDAGDLHSYNTGQEVHYGGCRGMDLSKDGKLLAVCGIHKSTNPLGAVNEPLVLLFDWEKGEKVRAQPADGIVAIGWKVAFLNGDVEVCGSGGSSGTHLLFWKTADAQPFHKLKLPDTARDMAVRPDGLHLATAHHDGKLRICRMFKGA